MGEGAANRKAPYHLITIATLTEAGPQLRTVVLRKVDEASRRVTFHTDIRSAKALEIQADPRIGILAYDPRPAVQIRMNGTATVAHEGPDVDEAWEATRLLGRRCYLMSGAPGTPAQDSREGFTEEQLTREPTLEESLPGRENFAIVTCVVDSMEWMALRFDGHLRARFIYRENIWQESWLLP